MSASSIADGPCTTCYDWTTRSHSFQSAAARVALTCRSHWQPCALPRRAVGLPVLYQIRPRSTDSYLLRPEATDWGQLVPIVMWLSVAQTKPKFIKFCQHRSQDGPSWPKLGKHLTEFGENCAAGIGRGQKLAQIFQSQATIGRNRQNSRRIGPAH